MYIYKKKKKNIYIYMLMNHEKAIADPGGMPLGAWLL